MELLEYQAKTLFREVGIPVLPSQQIYDPRELKQLRIPYPVVLKSQVRAGGRGRAGGVRFVENTIDAIAAAGAILSLPIGGDYPELLLAEARYAAQQELYLAVVLDYHRQCPTLLGSAQGGIDVDTALDQIQTVPVEGEFSPFYARRLAIQMGLTGDRIVAVSHMVEKMYHLFARKDLDSVEINPLGIDAQGHVMALDGKITLSAAAMARHSELKLLLDVTPSVERVPTTWEKRQGKVGLLCTDEGLAMMLWDTLAEARCSLRSVVVVAPDELGIAQLSQTLDQWSRSSQYTTALIALPDHPTHIALQAAIAPFQSPEQLDADFQVVLYRPGHQEAGAIADLSTLIDCLKSDSTSP